MNPLEQRLLQLDKLLAEAQLNRTTIFRRFRDSLVEFEADFTRAHSEASSIVEAARMLLSETGNICGVPIAKMDELANGQTEDITDSAMDGKKEEGKKNGLEESDGQKEEISEEEENELEEANGKEEDDGAMEGHKEEGTTIGREEADGQAEEFSDGGVGDVKKGEKKVSGGSVGDQKEEWTKIELEETNGQKEEVFDGAMDGQKEEGKTNGLEEGDGQAEEFFGGAMEEQKEEGKKNGLEESDGQKEEADGQKEEADGQKEEADGQKEEADAQKEEISGGEKNGLGEADGQKEEFSDGAMEEQKEEGKKHELEEADGQKEEISDGSMDGEKEEGTKDGAEDQQVAAVRVELSGIELVRSTLFRNIIVAYTGLSRDEREHLSALVHKLGGQVWSAVDQKFTHLIADKCDPKSDKYNHARRSKLPVVLPLWINAAVKAKDLETLNAVLTNKFINAHKTPIFAECEISVSGFLGVERVELGRLCTHLITATNSGQKYLRAREWGTVKVVSSRWLYESVEVGYRLPEDDFVFDKKEDDQLSTDSYVTTASQQQSVGKKHKKLTILFIATNEGVRMDSLYLARIILDRCNSLLASRSRYTSKEEFARVVLQTLLGDSSIDLLLLKPHFDSVHADALNRLNALIGFESTVFMTIYVNDVLFDEFIELFSRHCIRSPATIDEANESVYMWLLADYLQYLLPVDEQKLNLLKNSTWLSGPLASLPTSAVTSPRRLLRPEVLAQCAPLEHVSLRSGAFKTLYPRLLQFVGTMLSHVASLSNWPSVAQFQVLRVILGHYITFLLSETEDNEFTSLKLLLLRKPLFVDILQNFLDRLLRNWPLDQSYCLLIEIWRTLVHHKLLNRCFDEKYKLFVQVSSQYYVDLIETQIQRMLTTDCKQLVEAPVLDYAVENIFRCEPILGVFEQRNLPAIDYLRALCRKLEDYRNGIQKKLDMCQKSRQRSVWSRLLQLIFAFTYTAPVNMNLLNAHIYSDTQRSFESTTDAMNRTSNLSLLNPAIPDHETDKWTKMLFLTPHGRLQVVNRQAKFDYAKYTRQISDAFPSMGYWDIRPIANFLHQLSIRWTDAWLVRYLRQHGRDSIISRFASAALLSGPSPPRFVPVFARYVPQHPSRLKLYKLASTANLIYAILSILLIFILFKMFL
uniref:BRCT domain-containing protein n=1 Tax=Globodera rostochiensis TaxID=31243 RepID=A0A914ICD2_GLORO